MQRIANLFERITPEVLEEASRKACSSRKNKLEVAEYLSDKTRLLTALYEQVRGGVFHSSTYRMFTLNERGKERLVADLPLYPDRILHWAICIVAEPELNRKLIAQTYASIPGRGYHQAVRQVYDYIRKDKRVRYALVFDIHHFFPEIKIPILKRKLENSIKDRRFLELMFRLLDEYSLPGLPLGNRYSPMLANLYLSKMDHTLKENHHVHYYVRFMDDVCILGYSKEWLHRILGIVRELLAEDGLELKKNYQIFPIDSRGIPFLGYRIFSDHVLLKNPVKKRMTKRLREIGEHEEFTESDLGAIASYRGVLKWCDGRHLEKKVLGPIMARLPHPPKNHEASPSPRGQDSRELPPMPGQHIWGRT